VTTYSYDITNLDDGGQYNNRLQYWETVDAGSNVLQQAWYFYGSAGQVERIVRQTPSEPFAPTEIGWFYYDSAARLWLATYGLGTFDEETHEVTDQTVLDANEYRYDATGRQRYVVRRLDVTTTQPLDDDRWQDYFGESIYGDYLVDPDTGVVTQNASYLAGVGRLLPGETAADYYGADLIGTHRLTTDGNGAQSERMIYTAFGERVGGDTPAGRYGYAGAWGYEAPGLAGTDFDTYGDVLEAWGWVHVGERYYDPNVGRFMQRDPIGIQGGINVYEYVTSSPTISIDPSGLWHEHSTTKAEVVTNPVTGVVYIHYYRITTGYIGPFPYKSIKFIRTVRAPAQGLSSGGTDFSGQGKDIDALILDKTRRDNTSVARAQEIGSDFRGCSMDKAKGAADPFGPGLVKPK